MVLVAVAGGEVAAAAGFATTVTETRALGVVVVRTPAGQATGAEVAGAGMPATAEAAATGAALFGVVPADPVALGLAFSLRDPPVALLVFVPLPLRFDLSSPLRGVTLAGAAEGDRGASVPAAAAALVGTRLRSFGVALIGISRSSSSSAITNEIVLKAEPGGLAVAAFGEVSASPDGDFAFAFPDVFDVLVAFDLDFLPGVDAGEAGGETGGSPQPIISANPPLLSADIFGSCPPPPKDIDTLWPNQSMLSIKNHHKRSRPEPESCLRFG